MFLWYLDNQTYQHIKFFFYLQFRGWRHVQHIEHGGVDANRKLRTHQTSTTQATPPHRILQQSSQKQHRHVSIKDLSFSFKARKSASKKINPDLYHQMLLTLILLTFYNFAVPAPSKSATRSVLELILTTPSRNQRLSHTSPQTRTPNVGAPISPYPQVWPPTRFCSFFAVMKFQFILDPLGSDLFSEGIYKKRQ